MLTSQQLFFHNISQSLLSLSFLWNMIFGLCRTSAAGNNVWVRDVKTLFWCKIKWLAADTVKQHMWLRGHADTNTIAPGTHRWPCYLLPIDPRTWDRGQGAAKLFERGQMRTNADSSRTLAARRKRLLPVPFLLGKARQRFKTKQKFLARHQVLLKRLRHFLLQPLQLSQKNQKISNLHLFL